MLAQSSERASDEQVAAWFSAAQHDKVAGNLAAAAAGYQKIIHARPDLAEARSNLGVIYYLQGRYQDALVQFSEARRLRPDLEVPLIFSGICHEKMHQYAQAVPVLLEALRARPAQSEIGFYLALSYSGLGQESRANEWFEKFAAQNTSDAEALYQLGASDLRLSSDQFHAAGADRFLFARKQADLGDEQNNAAAIVRARYEQAIALRPDYPNLHWRLARVILRAGDRQAALSALQGELALQPEHVPALLLASELDQDAAVGVDSAVAAIPHDDAAFAAGLRQKRAPALAWLNSIVEMQKLQDTATSVTHGWPKLGALDQTLEALWLSIRSRADEDWALDVYVRCRIARGELPQLRVQLESLIKAKPAWLTPRFFLGDVFRRLSLAAYAQMVELDPAGYRTLLIEAETLEAAHNDEEAEKAYRAALSARPDAAGIHYRLCALQLRRRHVQPAIAECRQELAADEYHTGARVALAEAYLEERQPAQALPLLRRALDEEPRRASALLALARAYVMLVQPAQAAAAFEQALKISPDEVSAHYQLAQIYQDLGRDADAEREFAVVRRLRERRRVPLHSSPDLSAAPR